MKFINKYFHYFVLAFVSLAIFFLLSGYLSSSIKPNWDLSGHLTLMSMLGFEDILNLFSFYDPHMMGGWPAFVFYGFLPHQFIWVLSKLLSPFFSDPLVGTTYLVLVCICTLVPVSLYYATTNAANLAKIKHTKYTKIILILFVAFFSLWWINYSDSFWGLGAQSLLQLGLLSQGFGMILLLFTIGSLFKYLGNADSKSLQRLIFLTFLILISHHLTGIFALSLVLMSGIFFPKYFTKLIRASLISVGLAAVWLLPLIIWSAEFTPLDNSMINTDIFQLIFQPFAIDGAFYKKLSGTFIVLLTLGIIICWNSTSENLKKIFTMMLIAIIIYNSTFVLEVLSIGFHSYRFYCFIILTIFSIIPAIFISRTQGSTTAQRLLIGILIVFISLEFMNQNKGFRDLPSSSVFSSEDKVAEYLSQQDHVGRVWVEHNPSATEKYLSPHYLYNKLATQYKIETLNNLFVQSSVAYVLYADILGRLGFITYQTTNLSYGLFKDLTLEDLIERLKDFGLTHIVSQNEQLTNFIAKEMNLDVKKIEKYNVLTINSKPPLRIQAERREILGFLDLKNNFSFQALQYWFNADNELYRNFQLIRLVPDQRIHESHPIIINSSETANDSIPILFNMASPPQIIKMNFDQSNFKIEHSRQKVFDRRLKKHIRSIQFLESNKEFKSKLLSMIKPNHIDKTPGLVRADKNEIELSGLQPKQYYNLSYSYFPLLSSKQAEVYHGGQNQMIIYPLADQAKLKFSVWHSWVIWTAIVVFIIAFHQFINTRKRIDVKIKT